MCFVFLNITPEFNLTINWTELKINFMIMSNNYQQKSVRNHLLVHCIYGDSNRSSALPTLEGGGAWEQIYSTAWR